MDLFLSLFHMLELLWTDSDQNLDPRLRRAGENPTNMLDEC